MFVLHLFLIPVYCFIKFMLVYLCIYSIHSQSDEMQRIRTTNLETDKLEAYLRQLPAVTLNLLRTLRWRSSQYEWWEFAYEREVVGAGNAVAGRDNTPRQVRDGVDKMQDCCCCYCCITHEQSRNWDVLLPTNATIDTVCLV